MNIDRRVKMMTGVLLLVVLVIGSFLFWSSHKVGSGIKEVEATSQLIQSAFMLRVLLAEYETHASRRALNQWTKQHNAIGQILNQEGAFESSDGNLIENVRKTYQAVTSLAPQVMKERPVTDGTEQREAHEMLMNLMGLRLEQLVDATIDLSTASQRTALRKREMVGRFIMATSMTVIFVMLVNLYLMKRNIVRPIEALARGANSIAEGNFDYVVETKSDDEIGRLAHAFNLMIGRLRDYLASLKESEERLRLAQSSANIGVWEWHPGSGKVTWTEELERLYGYGAGTFPGTYDGFRERVHPDDLEAVESRYTEAVKASLPFDFDFRIQLPSGETRWVNCKGAAHYDETGIPHRIFGVNADITEHKQAEQALRESEERYRRLHETMMDAFVVVDMEGKIQESNQTYQDMLGYSPEELRHLTYVDLTPDKWHAMEARIVRDQILARGYSDIYEKEYRRKDGSIFPIELRSILLRSEDGVPSSMWAIVRDITDRKQTEEALRKSRDELGLRVQERTSELEEANSNLQKEIIEHTRAEESLTANLEATSRLQRVGALYIGENDLQQVLEEIVEAAIALTHADKGNIQLLDRESNSLKIVAHKGFDQPFLDFWNRTYEGQGVCDTALGLGQRIIVEDVTESSIFVDTAALPVQLAARVRAVQSTPLVGRSGRVLGMISTHFSSPHRPDERTLQFLDILVRQTADIIERAEYEDELRLMSLVVEGSNDAIIVQDLNGFILKWNSGAVGMYGWSESEAAGMNIMETVLQDERDEYRSIIDRFIACEEVESFETRRRTKDGGILDVWLTAAKIRDRTGKVIAVTTTGRDITGIKKAEANLKQTLADLSRSNQDLQQFAYVASHDLQEPLRNVASCLQMLEKKYRNNIDPEADKLIHYAVEGSLRMKALLKDLLTYSRVATKGESPVSVDFGLVLDRSKQNLRLAISDANAVITHDPLPRVFGDGSQLSQVFQNLIQNAIKFRRDEPPKIHVSAIKENNEWVFSVKDNGIGIGSDHLERIFVIFQRLHKRGEYEGTGIGLAIVKKVIERHGGRVWAESEPGVGSNFYFTILE